MSAKRDVSYILQVVRKFLLGREWTKNQLRHKGDMSSRSPPHPLLPGKVLTKLEELTHKKYRC